MNLYHHTGIADGVLPPCLGIAFKGSCGAVTARWFAWLFPHAFHFQAMQCPSSAAQSGPSHDRGFAP